jgi:hypothetical protein
MAFVRELEKRGFPIMEGRWSWAAEGGGVLKLKDAEVLDVAAEIFWQGTGLEPEVRRLPGREGTPSPAPAEVAPPAKSGILNAEEQAKADELRAKIKKKFHDQATGEKPSVGIDIGIVGDLTQLGALYVKAGSREFAKWSAQMIADFGEVVRPYLKPVWNRIKKLHADLAAGMTEEGGEAGERVPIEQPGVANQGTLEGVPPEHGGGVAGEGVAGPGGVRGPEDNLGGNLPGGLEGGPEPATGGGGAAGAVGVPPERGGRPPAGTQPRDIGADEDTASHLRDYRITEADDIGAGGLKAKAKGNFDAIKLLKAIEAEGRPATPEEQTQLIKYVGWGALPQIFNPWHDYDAKDQWKPMYDELLELLTNEEYEAAKRSTVNAHYTSPAVIRGIWSAMMRLGMKAGASVLEPSMGVGHFFGLMPDSLMEGTRRSGVELDSITGRIAQLLYPEAAVYVRGFETVPISNNFYDVIISNIPFGAFRVHDPKYKKYPALTASIHNYFFVKAIDKVRPGGIVAFITSSYTMDAKDSTVRRYLESHADLVGAIRLPNTTFKKNAGTEVTTDIVFLRKRGEGETSKSKPWIEATQIDTPTGGKVKINEYFAAHPEMMLGTMTTAGNMYGKEQPTLEGEFSESALMDAITNLPQDVMTSRAWKP